MTTTETPNPSQDMIPPTQVTIPPTGLVTTPPVALAVESDDVKAVEPDATGTPPATSTLPIVPLVKSEPVKDTKLRRRIVSAFKPAQVGPNAGKFYITYVSQAGEEVTIPATEEVYNWTRTARPETDCHSDWVVNVDAADTAVGVIRKPHLRQVLPSQIVTDGKHMVLVKSGQSYDPVQLPDRFDVESLSEAIALLSKTSSYRTGEKLGRFTIKQVVSDTENTYVALDLQ